MSCDQSPVTRERLVAKYLLLHGPLEFFFRAQRWWGGAGMALRVGYHGGMYFMPLVQQTPAMFILPNSHALCVMLHYALLQTADGQNTFPKHMFLIGPYPIGWVASIFSERRLCPLSAQPDPIPYAKQKGLGFVFCTLQNQSKSWGMSNDNCCKTSGTCDNGSGNGSTKR